MQNNAPTLEEIQAMCLEIQEEWSERERVSRIADDETRTAESRCWSAPAVRLNIPPAQAGC